MEKIALGMSGGLDSSVSALLLKEQGYEVTGVYLQMLEDEIAQKAIADAKMVAEKIGIKFVSFDIRDRFKEKVIKHFIDSYLSGITPNPCIICNKEIKFKLFFECIKELGIEKIATGHYARIEYDEELGKYLLKKGMDPGKDQTYFLHYLNQEILSKVIFPLGEMVKDQVKEIAEKNKLGVSKKKESQEICFIPDNDYKKYLIDSMGRKAFKKGKIKNVKGEILGQHQGLPFYTIGQRKGLGLSLPKPSYVVGFDLEENVLIVDEHEYLFSKELIARDYSFTYLDDLEKDLEVEAKVRYSIKTSKAKIMKIDDYRLRVVFDEKQRAITPGQSVAFYDGDVLIGGGIIEKSL